MTTPYRSSTAPNPFAQECPSCGFVGFLRVGGWMPVETRSVLRGTGHVLISTAWHRIPHTCSDWCQRAVLARLRGEPPPPPPIPSLPEPGPSLLSRAVSWVRCLLCAS